MDNYFKYLNIKPLEEKWGFYISTVGYSKIAPNQDYPNNREHPQSYTLNWNQGRILNGYYLIFISKGEGVFESALTPATTIQAGTCFFLFPSVWHRYKPNLKTGWEEYWVGFNGYYAEQLMSKNFSRENPFTQVGLNNELLVLYRNLIDTVRNATSIGYPQQMSGITLQILGLVNAVTQHQEHGNDPIGKLISKAKFFLQDSLEKPLDMETLAQELPMGYSSFRKVFKKITGQSPNQYHLNLRLNKAKELLAATTLNINQVADQTGFESVFYFSKLFKKKNGMSPKYFRSSSIEGK